MSKRAVQGLSHYVILLLGKGFSWIHSKENDSTKAQKQFRYQFIQQIKVKDGILQRHFGVGRHK